MERTGFFDNKLQGQDSCHAQAGCVAAQAKKGEDYEHARESRRELALYTNERERGAEPTNGGQASTTQQAAACATLFNSIEFDLDLSSDDRRPTTDDRPTNSKR
jgi:hypothetical protein